MKMKIVKMKTTKDENGKETELLVVECEDEDCDVIEPLNEPTKLPINWQGQYHPIRRLYLGEIFIITKIKIYF
jgi:hypothetical protein